jgi:hypothetical protein
VEAALNMLPCVPTATTDDLYKELRVVRDALRDMGDDADTEEHRLFAKREHEIAVEIMNRMRARGRR